MNTNWKIVKESSDKRVDVWFFLIENIEDIFLSLIYHMNNFYRNSFYRWEAMAILPWIPGDSCTCEPEQGLSQLLPRARVNVPLSAGKTTLFGMWA